MESNFVKINSKENLQEKRGKIDWTIEAILNPDISRISHDDYLLYKSLVDKSYQSALTEDEANKLIKLKKQVNLSSIKASTLPEFIYMVGKLQKKLAPKDTNLIDQISHEQAHMNMAETIKPEGKYCYRAIVSESADGKIGVQLIVDLGGQEFSKDDLARIVKAPEEYEAEIGISEDDINHFNSLKN